MKEYDLMVMTLDTCSAGSVRILLISGLPNVYNYGFGIQFVMMRKCCAIKLKGIISVPLWRKGGTVAVKGY